MLGIPFGSGIDHVMAYVNPVGFLSYVMIADTPFSMRIYLFVEISFLVSLACIKTTLLFTWTTFAT